jgi:hypothetical protein
VEAMARTVTVNKVSNIAFFVMFSCGRSDCRR